MAYMPCLHSPAAEGRCIEANVLTRREYGTWRIEEVGLCGALDKRNFASEVSLSRDVGPSSRRLGIIQFAQN